MIWQPRLVVLDIDGTLVDRQGQLPAATHAAVQRVVATGTPVILATGRSWGEAKPVYDALELPHGYAVVGNGTMWGEYPPAQVRRVHTFDPRPVIERVVELAPNARIAVEDVAGGFRLNRMFPDGDLRGNMMLTDLEDLSGREVARIIVRDPDSDEHEFKVLAEKLGMHGVSYSVGWSAWLDITPAGINKASALDEITTLLGIDPDDVLVIGDGRNDIEMIKWAGRGVALGDAPWEVQEAADDVTANFEDGGTALELDRWFGLDGRRVLHYENERHQRSA